MRERRRILTPINSSIFQYFFVPAIIEIIKSPVPKGAKYISACHDFTEDRFYICFEHKSFKAIPEGECFPIIKGLEMKLTPKKEDKITKEWIEEKARKLAELLWKFIGIGIENDNVSSEYVLTKAGEFIRSLVEEKRVG